MLSVSSFGEVLIDLIPNDDGSLTPYVGGAPANVAAAVAKLGGDSCFIGGISHDGFGLKIRACLEQLGVKFHHSLLVKNKTALVAVSLDGDGERSFEFYRDNTADLSVNSSKLAKLDWSATDIFHFCSNTLVDASMREATLFALKQMHEVGGIVSFDVNLRLNLWPEDSLQSVIEVLNQAFSFCHIVKFSREELEFYCQRTELSKTQSLQYMFELGVDSVIVTDGGNEIELRLASDIARVQPPISSVQDTTAGGDSFVGGLLFQLARLSKPELLKTVTQIEKMQELVKFAAKCGAFTVARKGAIEALPSASDI